MDNNQKLDFILRYERKRKIKRLLIAALIFIFAGSVLIYSQYKNFEDIQTETTK